MTITPHRGEAVGALDREALRIPCARDLARHAPQCRLDVLLSLPPAGRPAVVQQHLHHLGSVPLLNSRFSRRCGRITSLHTPLPHPFLSSLASTPSFPLALLLGTSANRYPSWLSSPNHCPPWLLLPFLVAPLLVNVPPLILPHAASPSSFPHLPTCVPLSLRNCWCFEATYPSPLPSFVFAPLSHTLGHRRLAFAKPAACCCVVRPH